MANPIIKVKQGELQGIEATNDSGRKYFAFKGIPFAEPPVGDLRFKAPIPIKPWTGVKDATKDGNGCIQINMLIDGAVRGAEDCLFLNVYTPQLPNSDQDKPLPVVVYIHGGGFKFGSGGSDDFGPDFYMDTDIVLVSINYRVGPLGFLCLNTPEVPGNAGLKDQCLALKWVKENIENFGGDSDNITISGISAGSASVEYQLLSPMSKGLFHKAILESGSVLNPWARNYKPKEMVEKLKTALGITTDNPDELLKLLQDIDVSSLIKLELADEEAVKYCGIFGFAPVIEKKFENVDGFLTSNPLEILKSGDFFQGPTIDGFCRNEGSMFKMFYGSHVSRMVNEEYADFMATYNVKDASQINSKLSEVYKMETETDTERVNEFLSDLMFISGIYKSLKYRTKSSHNNNKYLYMFSYHGDVKVNFSFMGIEYDGAMHGAELPYLCKNILIDNSSLSSRDQLMKTRMIGMWTNFAKFGNPTPEDDSNFDTTWKPITNDDFSLLQIDDELKMIEFPWINRMKVWEELFN